jgi:hypothetical protein
MIKKRWLTAGLLVVCLLGLYTYSRVVTASTPKVSASSGPKVYLPLIFQGFPLRTVFGAEMSSITNSGGLTQVSQAGMSWVRRNALIWSDVEPTLGMRNWTAPSVTALEQELINASSNNMQVVLIVRSAPSWAQQFAGYTCGAIKSSSMTAFGDFMRDVVARYSGPPYNVKYWEMWNEEDIDPSISSPTSDYGCWGNQNDPYYGGGYYANMLQAVYPKIKGADSQAQVLVGGLLLGCDPVNPPQGADCKASKFLEGILKNGGGSYFDGVSFHAYDYYWTGTGVYINPNWASAWNTTGPVVSAKITFLKNVLSTYGVSSKFLMNTEAAILCDSCTNDPTFETTKAYYIVQEYAATIAGGLRATLWYSVLGWRNSALLNPDLSPRPGYVAYQFAQSELRDSQFVANLSPSDIGTTGVKGYKFNRSGRQIWVLWSLDGATHSMTLPGTPLKAWDALGTSMTPSASMTIDLKPIYLEW